MMKHYPKIGRIPWDKVITDKRYLTPEEVEQLLSDEVVIEEKIDGKTSSCNINVDDKLYGIFAEMCKWRHSIPYDMLPNWNIIIDIWDYTNERFLDYSQKLSLCNEMGTTNMMAPHIQTVKIDRISDLIPFITKSKFARDQMAEGIVVKNYKKQLFGKLVRNEFITGIEEHWMLKEPEMNRLA